MSSVQVPANGGPPDWNYAASIFGEIGNYERHYNTMQTVYRNMASTWLLAALVGSGVVMQSRKDSPFLINQWSVEVLLGAFGAVGIALLWLLDLKVYHRLLLQVYRIGKLMEENWQLPSIRSTAPELNVRKHVATFYAAAYGTMLTVAALGLQRRPSSTGWDIWQVSGVGVWILLAALGVWVFFDTEKRDEQTMENLEDALGRYLGRMLRSVRACKSLTDVDKAALRQRLLRRCQELLEEAP